MKKLALCLPMLALTASEIPDLTQLQNMTARFAPTELHADASKLSPADRRALVKLIEASRVLNDIFLNQLWSGNQAMYAKLKRDSTPLGKARLHYFWINKGPWSDLDGHTAFLPDVPPKKLPGANFYPPDMTKEEFESSVKALPAAGRSAAEGFFTVIAREPAGKLTAVPYSKAYSKDLERASRLLREAAELTDNQT